MKIKNRKALKLDETKPIDEIKGWTISLRHDCGNDKMWSIYDENGLIVICFTERDDKMSICYKGKKAIELIDEIVPIGKDVVLFKFK